MAPESRSELDVGRAGGRVRRDPAGWWQVVPLAELFGEGSAVLVNDRSPPATYVRDPGAIIGEYS